VTASSPSARQGPGGRRGPDDHDRTGPLHGLTRPRWPTWGRRDRGYPKNWRIVGVGYRALPKGRRALGKLAIGYSTVNVSAPDGVTFAVPHPTRSIVRGSQGEGRQVAADIRKLQARAYKGKGVRYAGERVVRRQGRAAK